MVKHLMIIEAPGHTPIRELLDHQMVDIPLEAVMQDTASRLFDNPEDYANGLADHTDNQHLIADVVRHESSHFRVAKAVGFETVYFALEVDEANRLLAVNTRLGGATVPKLAYAAIIAAPIDPSEFDIADIHAIGYRDVTDVAERILQWNRNDNSLRLPVPHGYGLTNL